MSTRRHPGGAVWSTSSGAEAMRVENGKLKVGNIKRKRATAKGPKPDRIAYPLEIPELAGAAGQALAQLSSGLVKLPVGILNAQDFKTCGHTFTSLLGCAGEDQSWALPTQPSAWLRLPRSPCRHTSQTALRINGARRAHPHEALRPMD